MRGRNVGAVLGGVSLLGTGNNTVCIRRGVITFALKSPVGSGVFSVRVRGTLGSCTATCAMVGHRFTGALSNCRCVGHRSSVNLRKLHGTGLSCGPRVLLRGCDYVPLEGTYVGLCSDTFRSNSFAEGLFSNYSSCMGALHVGNRAITVYFTLPYRIGKGTTRCVCNFAIGRTGEKGNCNESLVRGLVTRTGKVLVLEPTSDNLDRCCGGFNFGRVVTSGRGNSVAMAPASGFGALTRGSGGNRCATVCCNGARLGNALCFPCSVTWVEGPPRFQAIFCFTWVDYCFYFIHFCFNYFCFIHFCFNYFSCFYFSYFPLGAPHFRVCCLYLQNICSGFWVGLLHCCVFFLGPHQILCAWFPPFFLPRGRYGRGSLFYLLGTRTGSGTRQFRTGIYRTIYLGRRRTSNIRFWELGRHRRLGVGQFLGFHIPFPRYPGEHMQRLLIWVPLGFRKYLRKRRNCTPGPTGCVRLRTLAIVWGTRFTLLCYLYSGGGRSQFHR